VPSDAVAASSLPQYATDARLLFSSMTHITPSIVSVFMLVSPVF
jgi:hypothetical protein